MSLVLCASLILKITSYFVAHERFELHIFFLPQTTAVITGMNHHAQCVKVYYYYYYNIIFIQLNYTSWHKKFSVGLQME